MKIIEVYNCMKCPHGTVTYCNHPKFKEYKWFRDTREFPEWCPLTDGPINKVVEDGQTKTGVCEKCGELDPVYHCENCGNNWPAT